jgi:WhiB family redox-sensing transcriptional regulator
MREPFSERPPRSVAVYDESAARELIADLLGVAPAWQERALCSQTDPEAFFPEKGGSTREAKRICARCEVKADCLQAALGKEERFGIWGGLSERERRALKRRAA